jgi:hypothetical protein
MNTRRYLPVIILSVVLTAVSLRAIPRWRSCRGIIKSPAVTATYDIRPLDLADASTTNTVPVSLGYAEFALPADTPLGKLYVREPTGCIHSRPTKIGSWSWVPPQQSSLRQRNDLPSVREALHALSTVPYSFTKLMCLDKGTFDTHLKLLQIKDRCDSPLSEALLLTFDSEHTEGVIVIAPDRSFAYVLITSKDTGIDQTVSIRYTGLAHNELTEILRVFVTTYQFTIDESYARGGAMFGDLSALIASKGIEEIPEPPEKSNM